MAKNILYDFWYSEKQKRVIERLEERYFVNTIGGKEYTECAEHSIKHKSNWDDAIFLGTFNYKDIRVKRM